MTQRMRVVGLTNPRVSPTLKEKGEHEQSRKINRVEANDKLRETKRDRRTILSMEPVARSCKNLSLKVSRGRSTKFKTRNSMIHTFGIELLYAIAQTALSCAWRVKLGLGWEDRSELAVRISKPVTVPFSRLT